MPLSYTGAVAWAVAAAALLQIVVSAMIVLSPGAETDIVSLGASEALVFVVFIFAVLRVHAPDRSSRDALALRPTHPALIVLGLALGLSVHFPAESFRQLVERYAPTPPEVLARRAALLSTETVAETVAVLLVVACVGPLVEELFYRGALFGALRRTRSLGGAAWVTAVCFVLGHFEPRAWPALLVVGLVLSFVRAASGSALPGLALHVGFNMVTVLTVVTGVASFGKPMDLGPGALLGGWVVTGALLYAVQRIGESDEARQARREDEP